MADQDANKRTYTLLLSIAFVGIGSWKLYERFYQEQEVETYQWILATGLVILGVYQLIGLRKK